MNNAYITLLTNNNFIYGVIGLYYKLKEFSKYELYCMITPNVDKKIIELFEKINLKYIKIDFAETPDLAIKQQCIEQHIDELSVKSFFTKFKLANLKQFDKIIYLDADLYIVSNIDELFNKPHMSYCMDSYSYYNKDKHWFHINGGLLVLEPNKLDYDELITFANNSKDLGFGDESVGRQYYNLSERLDLCLPCYYNCWISEIKKLKENYGGFNDNNIKVIHMIGNKPGNEDFNGISQGINDNDWKDGSKYKMQYINYLNSCILKLKSKNIECEFLNEIK